MENVIVKYEADMQILNQQLAEINQLIENLKSKLRELTIEIAVVVKK